MDNCCPGYVLVGSLSIVLESSSICLSCASVPWWPGWAPSSSLSKCRFRQSHVEIMELVDHLRVLPASDQIPHRLSLFEWSYDRGDTTSVDDDVKNIWESC